MAQKIIAFVLTLGFFITPASARMVQIPNTDRFQKQVEFNVTGITTPKVVEYKTLETVGDFVALKNNASQNFVPHQLRRINVNEPWVLPVESSSNLLEGSLRALQDQNQNTFASFDTSGSFLKSILFNNPTNHKISEFHIDLDTNSNNPKHVSISAKVRGSETWQTLVNEIPYSSVIRFPEVQPLQLRVTFLAQNFLRITELEWTTQQRSSIKTNGLSFYAEEGETYTLYTQPAFGQSRISTNYDTPTRTDNNTPEFNLPPSIRNPNFDNDYDDDGIPDTQDLCPRVSDPNNTDRDKNGLGDACEDPDQDGLNSAVDNCPFEPNQAQTDSDDDGIGDACDPTENRFTEQSGWWINLSFGIMVVVLLGLIGQSAWKAKHNPKK